CVLFQFVANVLITGFEFLTKFPCSFFGFLACVLRIVKHLIQLGTELIPVFLQVVPLVFYIFSGKVKLNSGFVTVLLDLVGQLMKFILQTHSRSPSLMSWSAYNAPECKKVSIGCCVALQKG